VRGRGALKGQVPRTGSDQAGNLLPQVIQDRFDDVHLTICELCGEPV
jgi:hypothetical protein